MPTIKKKTTNHKYAYKMACRTVAIYRRYAVMHFFRKDNPNFNDHTPDHCYSNLGQPMRNKRIIAHLDRIAEVILDLDFWEIWDHECDDMPREGQPLPCGVSSPTLHPDDEVHSTVANFRKYVVGHRSEYPVFNHGCDCLLHNVLDVRIDPDKRRVYLCGNAHQGTEMGDDD